MVIVCMAMIDDRRQRMMMFRGWKLYCGDFVGGRLTLTLKYQFSLILESAGQKVFSCFHVFFSYLYETLSLLQHGNLEGVLFKEIATDILEPGLEFNHIHKASYFVLIYH